MRVRRFSFILLSIVLLVFSYNACDSGKNVIIFEGGSGAGNPMAPAGNQILFALCGVISRCHSEVSIDSCKTGILKTNGFSNVLGVPSSYQLFSQIIDGEKSGTLTGNMAVADACYDKTINTDCNAPQAQDAYDSQLSNPFAKSPALVQNQTCQLTYSPVTYRSTVIADNPLSYWRLNETSGVTAFDEMGNNNGTYSASVTLGAAGGIAEGGNTGIGFTKANPGYVDFNLNGINMAQSTFVTVEYWMRWSGNNSQNGTDLMPFAFDAYNLWLFFANSPYLFGYNTGNGDIYGISGNAVVNLRGAWHHVVAVMVNMSTPSDISKNKIYLNSVLQTGLIQNGNPRVQTASSRFRISGQPQDTIFAFDGELDEFSVYNYELTGSQVSRHYQNGKN